MSDKNKKVKRQACRTEKVRQIGSKAEINAVPPARFGKSVYNVAFNQITMDSRGMSGISSPEYPM